MLDFWKSKDKIKFYSFVKEVQDHCPIELASANMPKWLYKARDDFKKSLGDGYPSHRVQNVYRCPGIVGMLSMGFVIKAWQDIAITTNGDGVSFEWKTPVRIGDLMSCDFFKEDVGYHSYESLLAYLPPKKETLKSIIKIDSPWLVEAPKNIKFVFMPMLYSDQNVFTTLPGILDHNINNSLNIQLLWHNLNGTHVIKAGTPLAHFFPVVVPDIDFSIEPYSVENELKLKSVWFKLQRKFLSSLK